MIFKKPSNIAVILPSRGQVFSSTMEDIMRELQGVKHEMFFCHGRSIPDCFNIPVEAALDKGGFTHYWFVEEDMGLYHGTLKDLLSANKPAVATDYPVTFGEPSGSVLYASRDTAYFSGTGCLLVETKVLESFKRPIFRTDIVWKVKPGNLGVEFTATNQNVLTKPAYGLHDITFGLQLYVKGYPIHILPNHNIQYRLVKRGKDNDNHGEHTVQPMDNFGRVDFSINFSNYTFSSEENLKEVYMDGMYILVSPEMEKRLLDSGQAEKHTLIGDRIKLDLKERPSLLELFV